MRNERKAISWGPRGIACPCCRPNRSSKRDAQRLTARLVRRAAKRAIRREVAQ